MSKKMKAVVLTAAATLDKEEISRLRGELEACHQAFRAGQPVLQQLKRENEEFKKQVGQQENLLTEFKRQIASQETRIVILEESIQENEPRLAAVKRFLIELEQIVDQEKGSQDRKRAQAN